MIRPGRVDSIGSIANDLKVTYWITVYNAPSLYPPKMTLAFLVFLHLGIRSQSRLHPALQWLKFPWSSLFKETKNLFWHNVQIYPVANEVNPSACIWNHIHLLLQKVKNIWLSSEKYLPDYSTIFYLWIFNFLIMGQTCLKGCKCSLRGVA